MTRIDDIINDLPEEIQDIVRIHMVIVTRMTALQLTEWVKQITGRHYTGAYQSLNDRMTPEERLAEQNRLNELISYYNKENKQQVDMWRDFFNTLIAILIQKGVNEIIEPGS